MKSLIKPLLFLFISLISNLNAQKISYGLFEYEQIESRNKGFKSHITFYNLNISDHFSTYTQIYNNELDEAFVEEQKGEGINDVIVVKPKKDEMNIVFNDFKKNKTYFKTIVAYEKLYVQEPQYTMHWKKINGTKKFGKRVCKKAQTSFRGRTYTAWYSPEIITNIGPWKFKNTPGLIFEIYDTDKVLHIKLNRFNLYKKSNINSWNLEKKQRIISLKEYIKKKSKEQDVVLERLNSRLPKGAKPFVKNKGQKQIEIFN